MYPSLGRPGRLIKVASVTRDQGLCRSMLDEVASLLSVDAAGARADYLPTFAEQVHEYQQHQKQQRWWRRRLGRLSVLYSGVCETVVAGMHVAVYNNDSARLLA